MIQPSPANMNVSDYCAAMERREIRINSSYQRSDKVWPDAAKSYLVESIILGFPIPKIYHHSITNIATGRTVREIIDGQQRSRTIKDFFDGKFPVAGSQIEERIRGRVYEDLEDDDKAAFLTYMLPIDMFGSITPHQVRQIFRRMNSYTVPLNPEELRHATFQGEFKWFIAEIAERYQETFKEFKILTEKALVRMQDVKLLTECAHALANGVRTTNKNSLSRLYEQYDEAFADREIYEEAFDYALEKLQSLPAIAEGNLAKPHIVYSLLVALLSHRIDIPDLANEYDEGEDIDPELVQSNFATLSDAMELDDDELEVSPYEEFVSASSARTNVKDQRETRIRWMMRALEEDITDI